MLARLRKLQEENEGGFTLIELLVVIIIIGILAAIAIPAYITQRKKGYDAQAKSDLRNLAEFEEIYLSDKGVYGTGAQILASEPTVNRSPGDADLRVVDYDNVAGYCLAATTVTGHTWYYDSSSGGLLPQTATACTNTYPNADGAPMP
jgi:prepilin-type N-terminal cleavage/methylation domain-containing protein